MNGERVSLLERLYNGEICPVEAAVPRREDYRPLCEEIGKERESIAERLSGEERERFSEWNDSLFRYEKMAEYANFSCRFRLGAMFVMEIFADTWDG